MLAETLAITTTLLQPTSAGLCQGSDLPQAKLAVEEVPLCLPTFPARLHIRIKHLQQQAPQAALSHKHWQASAAYSHYIVKCGVPLSAASTCAYYPGVLLLLCCPLDSTLCRQASASSHSRHTPVSQIYQAAFGAVIRLGSWPHLVPPGKGLLPQPPPACQSDLTSVVIFFEFSDSCRTLCHQASASSHSRRLPVSIASCALHSATVVCLQEPAATAAA